MPRKIANNRPAALAAPYEQLAQRMADKRFYASARWRHLRDRFLRDNPLCSDCRELGRYVPAEHVHHKLERKARPDLAYEEGNLQSLCQPCHNSKRAK